MNVTEFRNQKIRNTSLAWHVYGHKVPLESLQDFTKEELETIKHIEEDKEFLEEIERLLR